MNFYKSLPFNSFCLFPHQKALFYYKGDRFIFPSWTQNERILRSRNRSTFAAIEQNTRYNSLSLKSYNQYQSTEYKVTRAMLQTRFYLS